MADKTEPRKSCVLYETYLGAVKKAPAKYRWTLAEAIWEYGLYGKEPDFSKLPDTVSMAFDMTFEQIAVNIDASRNRYIAAVENGKKGGAPKGNKNARRTTKKQPEKQPENNRKTTLRLNKNNLNVDVDVDVLGNPYKDYLNSTSDMTQCGNPPASIAPNSEEIKKHAFEMIDEKARELKAREEEQRRIDRERHEAEREAEEKLRQKSINLILEAERRAKEAEVNEC